MPHILIAESLHRETLEQFIAASNGKSLLHDAKAEAPSDPGDKRLHFYYQPAITLSQLEATIGLYDALIVRPKPVSRAVIERAGQLRLIIRGGTGVNSIDVAAASKQGIVVENTPGQNSIATAEFTFAFLFELVAQRKVILTHVDVMESDDKALLAMQPEDYAGYELFRKHIAIIGLGAIGQAVAARAKAFGMKVTAYSRSFASGLQDKRVDKLGIHQAGSIKEAIANADIVSLHTPLTAETQHMVGREFLAAMKPGAYLINTARPQLIDPEALEQAVASGTIGGVAVDGDPDLILPLVRIARTHSSTPILLTHHIADATEEAQINIARECLAQIAAFFLEGRTINQVNG